MNKFLTIIFFTLITFNAYSKTLEIKDDWSQLFSTHQQIIILSDEKNSTGVMVETSESMQVLFYFGTNEDWQKATQEQNTKSQSKIEETEKIIFDFNKEDNFGEKTQTSKNFDIYHLYESVAGDPTRVIYIYDRDNKQLHKIYLNNDNPFHIKSVPWVFGDLMSVIKGCGEKNEQLAKDNLFISTNAILTNWPHNERSKDYQNIFYLNGDTAYLTIADKFNKAIFSQSFGNEYQYLFDIGAVDQIYDSSSNETRCELHYKISIKNGKLFLGE